MKKLTLVFVLGFAIFLGGCTDSDSEIPRNVRLDELKTVKGKENFYMASPLECQVLTSTDATEEKKVFRLDFLQESAPTIAFAEDDFVPIDMEIAGEGPTLLGFLIFSNRYGQSYLLLDVQSGVFSVSHLDLLETGAKTTSKGNCLPLENLNPSL